MYRLYKDHTHEVGGKLVKDIENLNRDPKTVILLDINPDSYSLQPENALSLKPWKGEAGDRELIKMGDFLIGIFNLFDFRA
jgi:import inner membrane translocase subunit TIM50